MVAVEHEDMMGGGLFGALCAVCCVLCAVYVCCVLCAVCCVLCGVCCVLCVVWRVACGVWYVRGVVFTDKKAKSWSYWGSNPGPQRY